MGTIYVAKSKNLQSWGGDVGLGKNLYKIGYLADGTPEEALAAGLAGETDWEVVKKQEAEAASEEAVIARLGRKEKMVDPTYYPRLKGAQGIFKVNLQTVENSMRIRMALDQALEPKVFKVKPADVAQNLINNALG
jgi:hypothetical protein